MTTTTDLGTDNAESVQIIIPAKQVKRKNDIYVCMVSSTHQVASAGRYIAIASTTVETANPIAELAPGIALLGDILERYLILYSRRMMMMIVRRSIID